MYQMRVMREGRSSGGGVELGEEDEDGAMLVVVAA